MARSAPAAGHPPTPSASKVTTPATPSWPAPLGGSDDVITCSLCVGGPQGGSPGAAGGPWSRGALAGDPDLAFRRTRGDRPRAARDARGGRTGARTDPVPDHVPARIPTRAGHGRGQPAGVVSEGVRPPAGRSRASGRSVPGRVVPPPCRDLQQRLDLADRRAHRPAPRPSGQRRCAVGGTQTVPAAATGECPAGRRPVTALRQVGAAVAADRRRDYGTS